MKLSHVVAMGSGVFGLLAGCAHNPKPEQVEVSQKPVSTPAPAAKAPEPAPAPKPTVEEDLAALERGDVLHFGFDEANLQSDSQDRLKQLATILLAHPKLVVHISGNCDELGTEEYNLALGQKRADVAKHYLVKLGVGDDRVSTVSYGKERPVNPGHDEQARAANRRDDLEVKGL
jgi:peptidoglycan-associated lipoprotein